MPDLLRREFLIKVLMTLGVDKLVNSTGLTASDVFNMSVGTVAISESVIDLVMYALGDAD